MTSVSLATESINRKGMAEEDPLDYYTLWQPLKAPELRRRFLYAFFNGDPERLQFIQSTENAHASFFARYEALCRLAINRTSSLADLTHHQLCHVRSLLKPGSSREAILSQADWQPSCFATTESQTLLDLCASVLHLMLVGNCLGKDPYDTPIYWEQGPFFIHSNMESAAKHDATYPFGELTRPLKGRKNITAPLTSDPIHVNKDLVRLPHSFTAESIERIAGIEIRWTSNLANHLLLHDDDTKLFLFHDVSILRLHQSCDSSPYTGAFMDETIRTIFMLIPPINGKRSPWFKRQLKVHDTHAINDRAGLGYRLNSTGRQIDRFHYWRDRLVLLKRTFDEAEPKTLRQLWEDDRRKTQWFTFWVAVLVFVMTIFFGILQSVGTWVQAWASLQQLKQPK